MLGTPLALQFTQLFKRHYLSFGRWCRDNLALDTCKVPWIPLQSCPLAHSLFGWRMEMNLCEPWSQWRKLRHPVSDLRLDPHNCQLKSRVLKVSCKVPWIPAWIHANNCHNCKTNDTTNCLHMGHAQRSAMVHPLSVSLKRVFQEKEAQRFPASHPNSANRPKIHLSAPVQLSEIANNPK